MNFMTDFLQNADPPTFLGQLALRAQTAHQVGCNVIKLRKTEIKDKF